MLRNADCGYGVGVPCGARRQAAGTAYRSKRALGGNLPKRALDTKHLAVVGPVKNRCAPRPTAQNLTGTLFPGIQARAAWSERCLFAVNGHRGLGIDAKNAGNVIVHVLDLGDSGAGSSGLDTGIAGGNTDDAGGGSFTHLAGSRVASCTERTGHVSIDPRTSRSDRPHGPDATSKKPNQRDCRQTTDQFLHNTFLCCCGLATRQTCHGAGNTRNSNRLCPFLSSGPPRPVLPRAHLDPATQQPGAKKGAPVSDPAHSRTPIHAPARRLRQASASQGRAALRPRGETLPAGSQMALDLGQNIDGRLFVAKGADPDRNLRG
jgi:hypothetical protein